MQKRGVKFAIFGIVVSLIFMFLPVQPVSAETSTQDLEEEVLSLEKRIEKNQKEMEEKAKLADTLKNHIETSEKEIENISLRIKAVKTKIEGSKTEIRILESEIAEKGIILQEKDEELDILLRLVYEKRKPPFGNFFFQARALLKF